MVECAGCIQRDAEIERLEYEVEHLHESLKAERDEVVQIEREAAREIRDLEYEMRSRQHGNLDGWHG